MTQFNVAKDKARFSEPVQKAISGEEVVIAKDNRPLLRLVPLAVVGGSGSPAPPRGGSGSPQTSTGPPRTSSDYVQ